MSKTKLIEAWACRDDSEDAAIVIYPNKPPKLKIDQNGLWGYDYEPIKIFSPKTFIRIYSKELLPKKGKKELMDIEL